MENTTKTDQQIETILNMIQTTKANFKQSGFHFLLWGWLIMILSLTHFALVEFTEYPRPYIVWVGTFIGVIISFIYGFTKGSQARVTTYMDRIYMWIWIGFLVAFGITFFIVSANPSLISAMSLVFAGYATFLSGITIRYRPLIIGGILFWIASIISFVLGDHYALLVTSVSVLAGYLIPGYMLRNKAEDGDI